MIKLSVEQLDQELRPADPRPPLRKALDTAKEVGVPVVGAVAAGLVGLTKTKPAVNVEIK